MKKIVILMLALMLALTSVSAMADQTCPGAGTLDVTVKYSMPESFEWSAPSEVTLNDDIFTDGGMKNVIKVTLTKAKLKSGSYVWFRLTNHYVAFTGNSYWDVIIDGYEFYLSDAGTSDYFTNFKASDDKDYVNAGDYSGSVTINASIQ